MTIREALTEGTAALAAAGNESPALDASLLLGEVVGKSRAALAAAGIQPLPDEPLAAFRRLVQRRLAGECAAYIVGKKEFYALEFAVNPAVLVPRPDTETLVEAALEKLGQTVGAAGSNSPARVLDLCTGSGAVAIALKHQMPQLEMWAADISAAALETAQGNAARLLLAPNAVRFCQGNLFEALPKAALPFSLIASNPPYIPSAEIKTLSPEVQNEPRLALDGGEDGLALIAKIINNAPDFLCAGGWLLLEADPRQMRRIAAELATRGFGGIQIYNDLSGQERAIAAVYGNGKRI